MFEAVRGRKSHIIVGPALAALGLPTQLVLTSPTGAMSPNLHPPLTGTRLGHSTFPSLPYS